MVCNHNILVIQSGVGREPACIIHIEFTDGVHSDDHLVGHIIRRYRIISISWGINQIWLPFEFRRLGRFVCFVVVEPYVLLLLCLHQGSSMLHRSE